MYQCLAAIDIGSNTVHLIVAATDGQQLTVLADESIFVRLAAGLWQDGIISAERINATVEALRHLQMVAQRFGATRILVAATEVARAARNSAELIRTVQQQCHLDPLVLSGLDEATLTFLGVTHGRHLPTNVAVADLGGGSLEVILTELGHGTWRTSLPIGSSFMHDRFAPDDPPQASQMQTLQAYVEETLAAIPRLSRVDELLISGGTVNALMRLVQQIQGRATGDRILCRADLDVAMSAMFATPSDLIAVDYRLRPERARLLPTGTVILAALLDHLHLPRIIVSPAGIREGIILAAANYGDDWLAGAHQGLTQRESIITQGVGGETAPLGSEPNPPEPIPALAWQPTADVAWTKIANLVKEMLRFRRSALAGDVEGVHAMRVIARRLRTLLDMFAPCFPVAPLRRLSRAIKQVAQALGGVRDADVTLESLTHRLQEAEPALAPGLRYLIKQQRQMRQTARRVLRRHLDKPRLEHLRTLVDDLHATDAATVASATAPTTPPTEKLLQAEEARHE